MPHATSVHTCTMAATHLTSFSHGRPTACSHVITSPQEIEMSAATGCGTQQVPRLNRPQPVEHKNELEEVLQQGEMVHWIMIFLCVVNTRVRDIHKGTFLMYWK